MSKVLTILSLFVFLLIPHGALGTQCAYRDFKDVVTSNRYTILASFVSVDQSTVRLKVEKVYVGKVSNEVVFQPKPTRLHFMGQYDLNTFEKGKTYLISSNEYEQTSSGPGRINLRICDIVAESTSEIAMKILKWLDSPEFKARK